jgi:hypothetical protein
MLEELNSLKRLVGEGLTRIRSVRTATRTIVVAARPPKGQAASPLAEKVAAYTKEVTLHLDRQEALLKEVKELADAIAKEQASGAQGAAPLDIARNLRGVVDTLQGELASPKSGLGTALRSFDVELKGVVVVENNQTKLVLPPPTERLEAHQVSTLRMSFAAVPVAPPEG